MLYIFIIDIFSFFIDGSPTRDRSPEPALFTGLFSSGADMLRRKLVGNSGSSIVDSSIDRPSRISARNKILLSRQEKRALRSLKLLEKVESIGLDNFMPSMQQQQTTPLGISPLAMQSSPAFNGRSRTVSPMAQLTSLKTAGRYSGGSSSSGDDDRQNVLENRTAIRSALMKSGLSSDSIHSLNGGGSGGAGSDSECSTTSSVERSTVTQQKRPTTLPTTSPASVQESKTADTRLKQMQRQKSRRGLVNGQRPDLGTVAGKVRPDLGRVAGDQPRLKKQSSDDDKQPPPITQQQQQQPTITQSFVGTISSLFFGRKGGLL